MDSMTPTAFAREVREASRDRIAAHRVGGAVCLHTGQVYIDGDEINVYIGQAIGGCVSMTDLGETMQRVSIFIDPQDSFGVLAEQMASQFGCLLSDGEIHCRCSREDAPARALCLAQCASALESALTAAAIVCIEKCND